MSTDPREFEHPIDGTGGNVTPEAIEAAAKALYALEPWQIASYSTDTYAWKALTPGDRYNYYRTATAALSAAYPLMEAQAKAEVLAPILALHQPEKRWTTPDYTGSFDTREEAAELDESYDGPNVDYFEICAHCGSIERDWAEDHAEEWNYKLAMWPCKTAAAVLP